MRSVLLSLAALMVPGPVAAQEHDVGPPPGRLVDVGGKNIHLHCTGSGSPTVVFEAGASSFAIDWSLVQPEIAITNRACSYDRLGQGWSDPGGSRDAGVVENLHALLEVAGEKPPFVMVGASRGALYARLFTARYPDEVLGLVLVDPSYEERLFTVFQGASVPIASLSPEQLRATMTPGPPVSIPRGQPQTGEPFNRLPGDLYAIRVGLDRRRIASFPDSVSFDVIAAVSEAERAMLAELRAARTAEEHSLADRPLVILSRGKSNNERIAAFEELARTSRNSRHTIVARAGHEIHLFEPAAVIEAIQDVLGAVRSNRRLVPRASPRDG